MFLVGLLSWWYGEGLRARLKRTGQRIRGIADHFSIPQLLTTLFSPYRQISAGAVQGGAGVQFRAFIDRSISRVIGAILRACTIVIGVIVILFVSVYEAVVLIVWPLIPPSIVAGVIITVIGWVPR